MAINAYWSTFYLTNLHSFFIQLTKSQIPAFANISMALPRSMPAESEYNEKSCPRRCSEQYNPICGVNEAGDNCVFVNDCYMAIENCNAAAEKGEFN